MRKNTDDYNDNEKYIRRGCLLSIVIASLGWIAVALLLSSCCTCKPVVVGNDRDSTATHTEWRIDTIKEVDSVFVSVKEKGDTVWQETYKYKYIYKYRDVAVHDTTVVVEEKTIEVPVEVEKQVPRKKTWFEQTQIYGFWLLLALWGIKYRAKIFKVGRKMLE